MTSSTAMLRIECVACHRVWVLPVTAKESPFRCTCGKEQKICGAPLRKGRDGKMKPHVAKGRRRG